MINRPLFSIVIANYNYGRFLEDAIKSVIAQSMYDKVELIICDAASTDNSVEVIKKYANGLPPNISYTDWINSSSYNSQTPPLITWWCSEKDGGQSAAFNKGFSHARGRFLTWLNADDILLPGALAAVKSTIQKYPHKNWFVGSSMYVDERLRVTKWFCNHRFSMLRARYGFLTCGGPSSFFTKDLFVAVGGIDEELHFLMDIDLWYKFYRLRRVKYKRTIAPVFAYRIHDASKMSGADIHDSPIARENRRRAQVEFNLLRDRYRIPGAKVRKLVTLLSLSFCDKLFSLYNEIRHKGKSVYEL
jgi:glycosyltransferase involved in cell wall biosynthesis